MGKKLTQCYDNRRKNHWPGCSYYHCKRYYKLIKEKNKWSFDGLNCYHNGWFFIFTKQTNLTLFPVFIEKNTMSKTVNVKYFFETILAKDLRKRQRD